MVASKKIGFVGGGNMGEALIKGLLSSGRLQADQIRVSDVRQDRLRFLQDTYQVLTVPDNAELTREVDVIVIAVKPQQMADVVADISGNLEHLPLLISIAAGVPLAIIERGIGEPVPVVRVMPNTPALVLAGVSAIAGGTHANEDHLAIVRLLFEAVGQVVEVNEANMDAVTGLSGSGPAYVLLFIEALMDAGVLTGLSRQVARELAVHTTLGAAKLLAEGDAHPAALKDQITSPGGTTIHGLAVLERAGMRGMVMEAVAAATQRSMELGKK
ncbi:MAG: pyrroline-5-carboxylate reductase [Deltaproteobacteria bacterium]|nr:MAG: pyrroline-5-carboxylate reductase [Deltaproteobacteria bacterium]